MGMENWEIQSMKDDMAILSDNFKGTEVGITFEKALSYINDLEELLVEVANSKERAIELLRNNGFVVKKITRAMEMDAKECEECGYEGDCLGCACSICIMQ